MIDGCDIQLKQPLHHLPEYTNRKSVTSVKLQAVCDYSKKFIDVSCGWPGSMHDARIFNSSSLFQALDDKLNGTDYHILGDSAYPLSVRLLTPYANNGFLDEVYIVIFEAYYLNINVLIITNHVSILLRR